MKEQSEINSAEIEEIEEIEEPFDSTLPQTFKLKYPVMVGKETTLSELTLSEVPDSEAMGNLPVGNTDNMSMKHFYPAIAYMAKRPIEHILKIKFADIQKVIPLAAHYLNG